MQNKMHINDVAAKLNIPPDAVYPYGHYIAKVEYDAFGPKNPEDAKMVLVTAMNPTKAGEGKTTTTIGLVDGLNKIGVRAAGTLREPSMGPTFGGKGGGTGAGPAHGGHAAILPEEEINLHMTGDSHAVAAAHNQLAALVEERVFHEFIPGMTAEGICWDRVLITLDRAMRTVLTGLYNDKSGPERTSNFHIDAASEIMAVLALATDRFDLRRRLGNMIVGYKDDGAPVTAKEVKSERGSAVGPMMALLKYAMHPNLVQTMEGQPVFVHAGPFGNIAHGCNSIIADNLARSYADFVVTEAGFGAELGCEKFMDIKSRVSGVTPDVAVVVGTVRATKLHGGVSEDNLDEPNVEAVEDGVCNLQHAVDIVRQFGIPAVVAINRFPSDHPDEVAILKRASLEAGAEEAVESYGFARGGEGNIELAHAVRNYSGKPSQVTLSYKDNDSLYKKVEKIARDKYCAGGGVIYSSKAQKEAERIIELGYGHLNPVIAKTHKSISADSTKLGRPTDHTLTIQSVQLSAGAEFIYLMANNILTMPGLSRDPNAFGIDLDENGNISGVI